MIQQIFNSFIQFEYFKQRHFFPSFQKADIGLADLTITNQRSKVLDFSPTIGTSELSIIIWVRRKTQMIEYITKIKEI